MQRESTLSVCAFLDFRPAGEQGSVGAVQLLGLAVRPGGAAVAHPHVPALRLC